MALGWYCGPGEFPRRTLIRGRCSHDGVCLPVETLCQVVPLYPLEGPPPLRPELKGQKPGEASLRVLQGPILWTHLSANL